MLTYVSTDWTTVITVALTLGWITTKIRRRITNAIHNRAVNHAIRRDLDYMPDRDMRQAGDRAQK